MEANELLSVSIYIFVTLFLNSCTITYLKIYCKVLFYLIDFIVYIGM